MNPLQAATAPTLVSASVALGALALGLGAASPAAADTATDAALQACIGPDTTLTQRLDALASAGWTFEADSPLARDRTFLLSSLRDADRFIDGGDASAERMVAFRDRAFPTGPNPGQPVEAAVLFEQLASAGEIGVTLEHGASALILLSRPVRSAENAMSLECTLMLADPVAAETPVALLTAAQFDLHQDESVGTAPSPVQRTIRLTRDDEAMAMIEHLDIGAVPAIAEILSKAGSDARLATLMYTGLFPVSPQVAP